MLALARGVYYKGFAMRALFASSLLILACASQARAQAAPAPKPWKDSAELGFINTSGNTKTTTLSLNNLLTYTVDGATTEFALGGMQARNNGVTTAEQYDAREKQTKSLGGNNYAFERVAWDRNTFSGVRSQWDGSVGCGRDLLNTDSDKLAAELGGGYIDEDQTVGGVNQFVSGRGHVKYNRTLSKTASFSQDAAYIRDFHSAGDYRLNTETSLTASITTAVSLKLSLKWTHVNAPPPGFKPDDTLSSAAVIFNF